MLIGYLPLAKVALGLFPWWGISF